MNSPQAKTNHEEHNWINTIDATDLDMVEPTDLMAEPTDLGVTIKEDHLQSRPNMSIKAWQSQEESIKNLTATFKQDRSLQYDQQTTEQPTACQRTLHSVESLT